MRKLRYTTLITMYGIRIHQLLYKDGIIMGTSKGYKPLTLDILNNNKNRIIGVVKAKIKQIK